jgi:hypothetical protein
MVQAKNVVLTVNSFISYYIGETETVMIVKDHLQGEFDKKAKYV